MIDVEPLDEPLDISFRPKANAVMRTAGVHVLCVEKCWATLRHYRPEKWLDVISHLKRAELSSRWFS
jgi:hypothetical protein